jgi:hypothetical protein
VASALAGFVIAGAIALAGQPVAGGIIGTVDIVGLIAVFVTGRLIRPTRDAQKSPGPVACRDRPGLISEDGAPAGAAAC